MLFTPGRIKVRRFFFKNAEADQVSIFKSRLFQSDTEKGKMSFLDNYV